MKKMIISMLLIAAPVATFAQLKVFSDGTSVIKRSNQNPYSLLTVSTDEYSAFYNYNMGINCGATVTSSFNMGLMAGAYTNNTSATGRTFGVFATAGNGSSGYNYGVYGRMLGNKNGAAVAGTLTDNIGIQIPGKYAGYFDGATNINGTLTVPTIMTPSDIRLKENVKSLADEAMSQNETLNNIMSLNVIKYNYIDRQLEISDTAQVVILKKEPQEKQSHYGISTQELQKLYPDLVCEGQDGYLGVNYLELVPILIRSIQELKQELDEVKGKENELLSRNATTDMTVTNAIGNKLYQNSPNPFKEQTIIRFRLVDDARNAAICIFDMTGKMLKKLPISSGETSVSVNGWELGEGMFLYTLMVNGQEIDTKRMLITN